MSTTNFGKATDFLSVSNDECTAAHWGRVWDPSPTKNATLSARETTEGKKSMSTTAQTYWQSSAEKWEGQRNYSLKYKVHKDAISSFSIRKDWRFAVRAKSCALHWRSRDFFFSGSREQLWERSMGGPQLLKNVLVEALKGRFSFKVRKYFFSFQSCVHFEGFFYSHAFARFGAKCSSSGAFDFGNVSELFLLRHRAFFSNFNCDHH